MSIISFINLNKKESGQSLSTAAIATVYGVEHNYKILLVSTDYDDKTLEGCFWSNTPKKNYFNPFGNDKRGIQDISSGLEGLIRTFASNRASGEIIHSYTKPVLKDRLDVLESPKAKNYKDYSLATDYYSQICDVANSSYDLVLIDVSQRMNEEHRDKIISISSLVIVNLNQNILSINDFQDLKMKNKFFESNKVMLSIGKYNSESKYSAKNVSRYLREKNLPVTVPYNILFSDNCSEGKVVEFLLGAKMIKNPHSRDYIFYNDLMDTVEKIEYKKKQIELYAEGN